MLRHILVGAAVAGITVLVVRSLPELRRYIKIRQM
ncbi:DUF6893 family small protein [Actinomadura alba]